MTQASPAAATRSDAAPGAPGAPADTADTAELSVSQLLEALDRLTTESQSSEELVWTVRARVTVLRQRSRATDYQFSAEQLQRLRLAAAVPDLVSDYRAARDRALRARFRDEVEALVARLVEIERALRGRRFAEQVASEASQLRALGSDLPVRAIAPELPARQIRERIVQAQAGRCDRCGRAMRLREGPHGYFWSCAAFPACFGARRLSADQARLLTSSDLGESGRQPTEPQDR